MKNLRSIAIQVMMNTIYHNLPVVKKMYKDTFQIVFPAK